VNVRDKDDPALKWIHEKSIKGGDQVIAAEILWRSR
jgi:hypothetical protein